MSHLDEFKKIVVHKDDIPTLSDDVKNFIKEYESIEMYPNGRKNKKKLDKVKEFKLKLQEMTDEIAKNKGKESNVECLILDCLVELLEKMTLKEVRQLKLEKLI